VFFIGAGCGNATRMVVGCVGNLLNIVVLVRFHFLSYLVNWMMFNRLLELFFVAFWVSFFLICKGLGSKLEIR
jgi:hypothetical protein